MAVVGHPMVMDTVPANRRSPSVSLSTTSLKSYQEERECGVGSDADEGEVADGDQSGQHGAEDDPGVDGLLPVVGTFETHDELKRNDAN